MHDYEDQFNQIIAGGRVHYSNHCDGVEYLRFLFSVADFLVNQEATVDEFRTWFRWNARYKEHRTPDEEEVNQAQRDAWSEERLLRRLGMMVQFDGREWTFRSFLPSPDVLRRVLMTTEEAEAGVQKGRASFLPPLDEEGVKKEVERAFPRLTPQVIDALRRGYQRADEYARQEAERRGVNLSRLFGK